MDRLHCLFHYPFVLAVDSPPRRLLALPPTFAIPKSAAFVDRDVAHARAPNRTLAKGGVLLDLLDLDSCPSSVCSRTVALPAIQQNFTARQLGGLAEILANNEQRLVTPGIRAR